MLDEIKDNFYNTGKRYLLKQGNLEVYVENLVLKVANGSSLICSSNVSENRWYTFTMFIGTSSSNLNAVYLDNNVISTYNLNYTIADSEMFIGTNSATNGEALDGYIKEIVISSNVIETGNRATIQNYIINKYEEYAVNKNGLGLISSKTINTNYKLNTYVYNNSTLKLDREQFKNNTSIIQYTFDSINNVVRTVKREGSANIQTIYNYDHMNRLVSSKSNGVTTNYV